MPVPVRSPGGSSISGERHLGDQLRAFRRAPGEIDGQDAEMVAEMITRLGLSLVITPEGPIPLEDDGGLRAYLARYLVPGIARLTTL